jgi:SHS2 domain-containing protein
VPYKFIEHTADIAVEVEAVTIEDLFSLSCHAWRDAALESSDTSSTESKFIYFSAGTLEELLVQLLGEINFMLFTHQWVFNSVEELMIVQDNAAYKLYADLLGEMLDHNTHHVKEEIKAVTYHQMKIEKINNNYHTRIVFDI